MQGSRQPKYRSDALEVLHETISDLHRYGVVDTATLRHFDLGCLTPAEAQDTPGKEGGPNRPS